MSGPTTAEPGERQQPDTGRPGPPKRRFRLRRPGAGGSGRPRPLRFWRLLGPVRRRRLLVTCAASALLLGGFGGWALYGSSWLRVEHVSVSGTRVLTPGQVREAAAVRRGEPLISVHTDAVAARLRALLPRVDTVSVARSWPHGIQLEVTERTPVLLIEKSGKFIEVDAKGVRFATVATAPKGVPALELATRPEAGSGASWRRFGSGRLVQSAVRVAGDLPAAVARDARIVKVRSYDSISVELTRGRVVAWGSGGQGAEKAAALSALMKAAPGAGHFDVSVPTAPAVSGS